MFAETNHKKKKIERLGESHPQQPRFDSKKLEKDGWGFVTVFLNS